MSEKKQVTAAFLVIGDEILSGRTQDLNTNFLALKLAEKGIQLEECRVVKDREDHIIAATQALAANYTYLFTSGGIGPTHDDITTASVAKAFDKKLEQNPQALAMLQSHYTAEQLNSERLKMANIPETASLIENPISRAPGFQLGNVFVLAGVPRIFQVMVENILHDLEEGQKLFSCTVSSRLTEGDIAAHLKGFLEDYPAVELGSYPYFKDGKFGVSLVLRSYQEDAVASAAQALEALLQDLYTKKQQQA